MGGSAEVMEGGELASDVRCWNCASRAAAWLRYEQLQVERSAFRRGGVEERRWAAALASVRSVLLRRLWGFGDARTKGGPVRKYMSTIHECIVA